MGLDSIELVMDIEKKFDIRIPDEEAEKITTVGKMYDVVWGHLQGKHSDKCNAQILFYKLRKSAEDIFHFPRQQFLLNTIPEDIFPKENRCEVYKEVANNINLSLPGLVLTKPWSIFLNSFGLVVIVFTLIYAVVAVNFYDTSKWLFLIPVVGLFCTSLLSNTLNPKRIIIAQKTIREFVENTLVLNYEKFAEENGNNRKDVELVINQIIVDRVGVNFDEISPEKSFTDDLGVD
jgi:acyl carrier protein